MISTQKGLNFVAANGLKNVGKPKWRRDTTCNLAFLPLPYLVPIRLFDQANVVIFSEVLTNDLRQGIFYTVP